MNSFESNYDFHQLAAKQMTQRIAANGTQHFRTDAAFIASYGYQAVNMFTRGGLIAALHECGMSAYPLYFDGNQPQGLKISPSTPTPKISVRRIAQS